MEDIHTLIRKAEQDYTKGEVTIGEYVSFDMHDTIERIDAYLNSKHVSGPTDSLGREKPFFNIVTAAVNIWYRATDIDRKNIKILPSNTETTGHAFVATILLQEWMRRERFGAFLNEWGRALARYGSAVIKFVEKNRRLIPSVVPWNRFITDPIDFDALPRIEVLYKTPSQLRANKNYDQDVVEDLIRSLTARETLDGNTKDDFSGFVKLYEVHGELPESYLTDEESEKYIQQMHVVSCVKTENDEYENYTLYRGREAKDPYMITHLIPEDGRTLAIGAVELLFDAQWMVNHSQKNIKDTLDLASRLIFQTSDANYVGRNVLSAIETGDILIHAQNQPLTQINNSKADITAYQNFAISWQNVAQEITSTPDALRGTTLPANTPYSLGAYLGGQANSLFEIMTENKGQYIEDIMTTYVIPFLKKGMDTKEEIVAILEADGITEIDAKYVPKEAKRNHNAKFAQSLIKGQIPGEFDQTTEENEVRQGLAEMGNMRVFKPSELDEKTWKQSLKDLEWKVIVEVTNEQADKQAVMQTLATLYTTAAQTNPVLANQILARVMIETGVFSPIQVQAASVAPPTGDAEALQITQQQ